MVPDKSVQIAVDRGGTFTDVYANWPRSENGPDREEMVFKLLSKDEEHYQDAPREGVRRVMEKVMGKEIPREEKFGTEKIDCRRQWEASQAASGVAGGVDADLALLTANALLERRGARHALLITRGFKDLLLIGTQARPKIFDLAINKPGVLYEKVVEVDERVTLVGYTGDPRRRERQVQFDEHGKVMKPYDAEGGKDGVEMQGEVVKGLSGEAVRILRKPDLTQVKRDLETIYKDGIRSLAVVLLHSYTYPDHENAIGELAAEVGFTHVSLSSQAMPMIKAVSRGTSATCDAYLTPVLKEYINGFFDGFDPSLRRGVEAMKDPQGDSNNTRVEFMTSDGGLTDVTVFSGLKSILSGPAGGVVGCALTSWDEERKIPVIGLDMGGTSTDVSRFDGRYELVFETTTAGVTVQSPQLDITTSMAQDTVAAGGGSRLFFRNQTFQVGPESAGADPGPACYRKGGPLAVTDANLLLGRLVVDFFPKIFGKNENEPLDVEASKSAFENLVKEINSQTGYKKSTDEIAWGFIKVANETMARPIRALTEARGYSTGKHILTCFGGAGGQHACSIASTLGIKTILIHRFSSVLSAYGMALADRVYESQEPSSETWSAESQGRLEQRLEHLTELVTAELKKQGFKDDRIKAEMYLNLRFEGTDTALMTLKPEDGFDFESEFKQIYRQEFGFILEDKDIVVDDVRVRGIGKSYDSLGPSVFSEAKEIQFKEVESGGAKCHDKTALVYFEETGRQETPIFLLDDLETGDLVRGPAIIIDDTQTIIVDPGAEAKVTSKHVMITLSSEET